jgi:hypothetical protein
MSDAIDPYRMDTPAKRRDAQWFADQVARFVAPDRRIHVRGVFYACVAAGDVVKPDGAAFANNADDEIWLGKAARYARWLGYTPFERLVDNKNDEPVVRPAPEVETPAQHVWPYEVEIDDLDADDLAVRAGLTGFEPRQPYRLVFFGEKTSLEDVLGPLAEELGTDLYLCSGQISDTLLHRMMTDAASDGRPLVIFPFSDCDPAGYWDMPTSIGRKLQALCDLLFPDLQFTVVHAALSPDQARSLDLPSSPLKEGEKRGALWLETYGLEQTEIDALATLRPDVLERLAREAVAPYYDASLAARVQAAREAWLASAADEIAEQIDETQLDALKARARAALHELAAVNTEVGSMICIAVAYRGETMTNTTNPWTAIPSVHRIEMMCDFIESDPIKDAVATRVPVPMLPAVGSLGFDIPLWVGLGMVGLWATLDAFAERAGFPNPQCRTCKRRYCVVERYGSKVTDAAGRKGLEELEDIRHLYAHNYAGTTDAEFYFDSQKGKRRKRHVFSQGASTTLSCGAQFSGSELSLGLPHLRFYCGLTKRVLEDAGR